MRCYCFALLVFCVSNTRSIPAAFHSFTASLKFVVLYTVAVTPVSNPPPPIGAVVQQAAAAAAAASAAGAAAAGPNMRSSYYWRPLSGVTQQPQLETSTGPLIAKPMVRAVAVCLFDCLFVCLCVLLMRRECDVSEQKEPLYLVPVQEGMLVGVMNDLPPRAPRGSKVRPCVCSVSFLSVCSHMTWSLARVLLH